MAEQPRPEQPRADRANANRPGFEKSKKAGPRPDFATVVGILLALGGIVGGLLMEGGKIRDVSQITAALIVLGGTLGAVMVSTPIRVLNGAFLRLIHVLMDKTGSPDEAIEELIVYATKARKNGLVSLESEALEIRDPFLRKALTLAVDGTDLQEIRNMMQLEIDTAENRAMAEAKVFESAGGYSPTIGIIGAVMGLIQVMKNLANIEEVGRGIAVAFVATLYGVGLANILLLPAATKIKSRIEWETEMKQLKLEGVVAIVEGLNPKLIRSKLDAYKHADPAGAKSQAKERAEKQTASAPLVAPAKG
ncbi:MAG TPA: flagellar motor protein [Bryobacteraceae bacterium]|jgi:chemotaxis protein MotA|nr:flagellar motor protein [Bryobacteraceae bacterium]